MRDYLAKEVEANRVVEVGDQVEELVISRFGVIPKRGQENQWRLILDLSYPLGRRGQQGAEIAILCIS